MKNRLPVGFTIAGIVAVLLLASTFNPLTIFSQKSVTETNPTGSHYVSIAAGADNVVGYVYLLRNDGSAYFTPRGTSDWTQYGSSQPPGGNFVSLAAGAGGTSGYLYMLQSNGAVYYTERGTKSYLLYTQSSPPTGNYVGIACGRDGTSGYLYAVTDGGTVYFTSRGTSTWHRYSQAQPPAGTYVDIAAGSGTTSGYVYLLTEDGKVYFTARGTGSWHSYVSAPPAGGGEFVSITAGSGTTAGYLYILTKDGKVYFTSRGTGSWQLYTQSSPPAGNYVSIAAGSGTTAGYLYILRSDGEVYFVARGTTAWYRYGAEGLPSVSLDHVSTEPPSFITYLGAPPTSVTAKAWADAAETQELTDGLSYSWSVAPPRLGNVDSTTTKSVSFTPLTAGTGKLFVNVSYGGITKQGYCEVTVSSTQPTLDYVTVTPSSASPTVGEKLDFIARGWSGTNELSGVTFRWSLSPPYLGSLNTTTGQRVCFTAQAGGNGKLFVNGTYAGQTKQGEASVEVTIPPPFHHVTVIPSVIVVLTGRQFPGIEAKAWADSAETQELTEGLSYAWSRSPDILGTITPSNQKIVTFTAGAVDCTGKLFVNVTCMGITKLGVCNVRVTTIPPRLDSVTVQPASAVVSVGGTQSFKAAGLNDSYEISGVTFAWSVSPDTFGTLNTTSGQIVKFTATTEGEGKIFVNGTYGGDTKLAEAFITVVSVRLTSVTISPSRATVPLGETQVFSAIAKDLTNSTLSGVAYSWRVIPWDLGILSSMVGDSVIFTPAKLGSGKLNLTARYGGITLYADAEITVVALGTLSGYVSLEGGLRIRGAVVKLESATLTKNATTDANGEYVILDIIVGTYNVTVSAKGYETLKDQITIYVGNNTKNFTLKPKVAVMDEEAGFPIVLALALIVILVVVSAVVAIFLWNRKKKQQKEAAKQRQQPPQYPPPTVPPQRYWGPRYSGPGRGQQVVYRK